MPKQRATKRLTARESIALAVESERAAIVKGATRDIVAGDRVLEDLEGFRQVSMLDFLRPGRVKGSIALKSLEELKQLSPHHQRSIKKMTIRDTIDGQVTTFEVVDILRVEELIGKATDLWKDGAKHVHMHLPDLQRLADASPEQLAAMRKMAESELKTIDAEIVEEGQ